MIQISAFTPTVLTSVPNMRYSKIREMDVSNGEGLGISLFVQGCHFHCRGCFNPETWDFNGGKEWTKEIEDTFIKLAGKPFIQRVSILGGEPLCPENVIKVSSIISKIRLLYPQKKIWVYTGYKFETLLEDKLAWDYNTGEFFYRIQVIQARKEIIRNIDILIDGQFQLDNQDLYNEHIIWAGSTNQRIIDIKKTMENKSIVLFNS